MQDATSFEDYIRAQCDARAAVSVTLGVAADGSEASIMTSSDKTQGTYFWKINGSEITMLGFIGDDD